MPNTRERVIQVIAAQFDIEAETITEATHFADDLGADSLELAELLLAFQEEFELYIEDSEVQNLTTVGEVIVYAYAMVAESPDNRRKTMSNENRNDLHIIDRLEDVANLVGIFAAAYSGSIEEVRDLVENRHAGVNVKQRHDRTPLHLAAQNNSLEVVRYLVDHEAKVNAKTDYGAVPLHYAASHNNSVAVINYLLSLPRANVNVKEDNGWTPLHRAAAFNDSVAICECLIANGADVKLPCDTGHTPLHLAARESSNPAVLKCLLDNGVNIDLQMRGGVKPLDIAIAHNSHVEIVECLILHGAKINEEREGGVTPLFIAATQGSPEVVRCLIRHGADVHAKVQGKTPLEAAIIYEKKENASVLREAMQKQEFDRLVQKKNRAKTEKEFEYLASRFRACAREGKTFAEIKDRPQGLENYKKAIQYAKECESRHKELKYDRLVQEKNEATTESEFKDLAGKFRSMGNYERAADLASECEAQYRVLKEQREERERQEQYQCLVARKNEATTEKEFKDLAADFRAMGNYKEAADLASECEAQYRVLKEQREERERQEQYQRLCEEVRELQMSSTPSEENIERWEKLADAFRAMVPYRNTAQLAEQCDEMAAREQEAINEQARRERYNELAQKYNRLIQINNQVSVRYEYLTLEEQFREMNGYSNTVEFADKCKEQYDILEEEEKERKRREREKRRIITAGLCGALALWLLGMSLFLGGVGWVTALAIIYTPLLITNVCFDFVFPAGYGENISDEACNAIMITGIIYSIIAVIITVNKGIFVWTISSVFACTIAVVIAFFGAAVTAQIIQQFGKS